jgi:hypothetical protein
MVLTANSFSAKFLRPHIILQDKHFSVKKVRISPERSDFKCPTALWLHEDQNAPFLLFLSASYSRANSGSIVGSYKVRR